MLYPTESSSFARTLLVSFVVTANVAMICLTIVAVAYLTH